MMEFGKNAAFIWASYGVSMLGIVGLILYTLRNRG